MLYKYLDSLSKRFLLWCWCSGRPCHIFCRSFSTKYISMNNQPCMVRLTLLDSNPDELYYYSFIIGKNRYDASCNTVDDTFRRIYFLSKMLDVNLKAFKMIKVINKSRTLSIYIACECRCEFFCRKCSLRQKVNNFKCQC